MGTYRYIKVVLFLGFSLSVTSNGYWKIADKYIPFWTHFGYNIHYTVFKGILLNNKRVVSQMAYVRRECNNMFPQCFHKGHSSKLD